jgi:hypothetical protein
MSGCKVCSAAPADTLPKVCGHLSMCNACAKARTTCPVCSKTYGKKGLIKVFLD